MAEDDLNNQPRATPASELDFNMMVINPSYGTDEVSKGLKDKLSYFNVARDDAGKQITDEQTGNIVGGQTSKWSELSFFTRDIRLGNITTEEVVIVRDRLKLAQCLLNANAPNAFSLAYGEGIGIIETSMSVKGFLRRIWNTIRNENIQEQREPAKRSWFGGSANTGGK